MTKPDPRERGTHKPPRSPSHHDREDMRQEREKDYVKQTEQEQQRTGSRGRQQQ